MTTRHPIAALLAGAVITLSACGSAEVPPSGAETPTVRPVTPSHATAWQAYYDATHPTPNRQPVTPSHATAWQAYYDATRS